MIRICSTCKLSKPITDYQPNKASRGGYRAQCRSCRLAVQSAYAKANKKQLQASNKRWNENNRKKVSEINLQWQRNNRDKTRKSGRKWAKANPENCRNRMAKRKANKLTNGVFFIPDKFMKHLYASACFYCGLFEKIEADHVIPLSRGGTHSMGNLVPACQTCNRSKNNKLIAEWKKHERTSI